MNLPDHIPSPLYPLYQLALDQHPLPGAAADALWGRIDPAVWALTRNPWLLLQTADETHLQTLAQDEEYLQLLHGLANKRQELQTNPTWFAMHHANSSLDLIAYFSMEFGLSEALPIYSGGLGILAGDHLKAASDLGVPIVGVGLLFSQGYFRQGIDLEGRQTEFYPYNEPHQLPIQRVEDEAGNHLFVKVRMRGREVWLRTWQVVIGRLRLYLLDSNVPFNSPSDRGITAELYGKGSELRLQQEICLGIGGWRLLSTLGLRPQICHLNEGHAAFAIFERTAGYQEHTGQSFEEALTTTRAGNLFTTHTPVAAGFDRFSGQLINQYFANYANRVGILVSDLLALGRIRRNDSQEPFNMAYLAVRGCEFINGVSQLHASVSREIFAPLFPRWPLDEIPVGYVTNGVHTASWESATTDRLWTKACGQSRWAGELDALEKSLRTITDEELWAFRLASRRALIDYVRIRLQQQLVAREATKEQVATAATALHPEVLTIGFARRFTEYKRPNLLLHDQERLMRLIASHDQPVQLVIAGKAHPEDEQGKEMIRQWHTFFRRPQLLGSVAFIADYDISLAQKLVQGVDLWINTPRRPFEASGTSGMKVLVNGGLNLSELDGWWAEAYSPDVGWALGDRLDHSDNPDWDELEAEALFQILEQEVIPLFYKRDGKGLPTQWIAKIRESMARLTPCYSTNRMVRQYTEEYYLPAAAGYLARAKEAGQLGHSLEQWREHLAQAWSSIRFGAIHVDATNGFLLVQVEVDLGYVHPEAVHVELFADASGDSPSLHQSMERGEKRPHGVNAYIYTTQVPATRAPYEYTCRIVPAHSQANIPLEAEQILWQK